MQLLLEVPFLDGPIWRVSAPEVFKKCIIQIIYRDF